jgi:peptidyl-prolyl cis-trans isomerase A (cyclophilin A)
MIMNKLLTILSTSTLLLVSSATMSAVAPAIVELQTNAGTIAIQLDYAHAPSTANNFISYVNSGFYKNVLLHRLVKGFVLQGGGFSKTDGKLKTTLAPIINEANNGLSNLTGTIAMARTSDPNSATSQFFINLADNTFLNYSTTSAGYAVFGSVLPSSMTRVRNIENLAAYNELAFSPETGLVSIDAVYTSDSLDPTQSITRISLTGLGKVVSTPAGIACGSSCSLSQPTGSAMALTATAATGYYFSGWQGDCKGFRRTLKLDTKLGNHNCTAVFSKLGAVLQ